MSAHAPPVDEQQIGALGQRQRGTAHLEPLFGSLRTPDGFAGRAGRRFNGVPDTVRGWIDHPLHQLFEGSNRL